LFKGGAILKSVVTSQKGKGRYSPKLWIAAALILLLVAAIAVMMNRKRPDAIPQTDKTAPKAKTVVPATDIEELVPTVDTASVATASKAPIPSKVVDFDPSATNGMPIGTAVPRIKRKSKEQEILQASYRYPTPGQARLPDGYIVTFKVPEEGHTVKFMIDHEKYICHPDGTFEIVTHKPVFEDKFEEEIINLAMPGATFLPHVLLNHTEEDLKAMLAREVVINPDDSDDVKEKKEAVAEMKKMISDYLADGGDYVDFVMEMHKYSKEERKLRVKGFAKLDDLLEEGRIEDARAFLESYNAILDENGFPALRLSKKVKAQLEGAETPEQ